MRSDLIYHAKQRHQLEELVMDQLLIQIEDLYGFMAATQRIFLILVLMDKDQVPSYL
jgi:hypothetical protein